MSALPTTLRLLSGEEVKVDKVHYALSRRHYRVSWMVKETQDGRSLLVPRGCVAALEGDRFEEAEDGWRHGR